MSPLLSDHPRVILVDVDGTLITYASVLPASATDAIRRARAAGHRVYPTTGRSRAEMPQTVWDVGFDGMIGGNGSYVEDRGVVVRHEHLSRDQCQDIVTWLQAHGLDFYLEANSGLYPSPGFCTAALPAIRAYVAGKAAPDGPDPATVTVDDVFPDFIHGTDLVRSDVNKISFLLGTHADLEAVGAAFPDLTLGSWGGHGHAALFGDLGMAGISKAHAAEVLLHHLGASREDAIGIGDGAVDIPLLEYCGVGVAMGNAAAAVRDMADLVTDDVEDDGLAHAFEALGLLG